MLPGVAEFVVRGIDSDGGIFPQPDWAERLCDAIRSSGTQTPGFYDGHLRAVTIEGTPALVVRMSLELVDEKAFQKIRAFVIEHRLQIRAGRYGNRDAEAGEPPFPAGRERRLPQNNDW